MNSSVQYVKDLARVTYPRTPNDQHSKELQIVRARVVRLCWQNNSLGGVAMVKRIKLKAKRTKAQTPAPKKDQIVGSKVNPEGSAGGSRGKIEVSQKIENTLKNKRDEQNQSVWTWVCLKLFIVAVRVHSVCHTGHRSQVGINGL
jgi:hypothetical protein